MNIFLHTEFLCLYIWVTIENADAVFKFIGIFQVIHGRLFKAMAGCRTVARTHGSAINNPTAAAVHSAFTVYADMLLFAFADKIAVFSEEIAAGAYLYIMPFRGSGRLRQCRASRYAHMTQTAVTAGEAVTAGQVIGYVGNTGDSTGFHLHFEVMQNGVRVNPMDMVSVR